LERKEGNENDNVLTWNIKAIQLPKINSNLLSMISFFVLCFILFTTSAVINNLVRVITADQYHPQEHKVRNREDKWIYVSYGNTQIRNFNSLKER